MPKGCIRLCLLTMKMKNKRANISFLPFFSPFLSLFSFCPFLFFFFPSPPLMTLLLEIDVWLVSLFLPFFLSRKKTKQKTNSPPQVCQKLKSSSPQHRFPKFLKTFELIGWDRLSEIQAFLSGCRFHSPSTPPTSSSFILFLTSTSFLAKS